MDGLGEQPTERCVGGGLVGAGLPEETFLAGERVSSRVDLGILFTTAILPFPTAVLASALAPGNSSYDRRVAVTVYALAAGGDVCLLAPRLPLPRCPPGAAGADRPTAEYVSGRAFRETSGVTQGGSVGACYPLTRSAPGRRDRGVVRDG